MKLSTKSDYGVRAILDVTFYGSKRPVQVKDISKRQSIPERFLEQVMASLKKAGLVEGVRGPQGGYVLAKSPSEITLADVVQALEGPIVLMECIPEQNQRCDKVSLCVIRDLWCNVQDAISSALKSVTLEDLRREKEEREKSLNIVYQI